MVIAGSTRTFLPFLTSTTALCRVICSAIKGETLDLNMPEPRPMMMIAMQKRPMIPLQQMCETVRMHLVIK